VLPTVWIVCTKLCVCDRERAYVSAREDRMIFLAELSLNREATQLAACSVSTVWTGPVASAADRPQPRLLPLLPCVHSCLRTISHSRRIMVIPVMAMRNVAARLSARVAHVPISMAGTRCTAMTTPLARTLGRSLSCGVAARQSIPPPPVSRRESDPFDPTEADHTWCVRSCTLPPCMRKFIVHSWSLLNPN
jgi:hypothetical protein